MDKVKNWILSNGRQLEKSLYLFFFEDGKKADVIKALKSYQNEDGGFGQSLEPDFRNPNSNPIACQMAGKIIQDIDLSKDHPMVVSLIEYLTTTSYKDGWNYYYSIPSNNDYPHAPWWHYSEASKIVGYNPTASLIGFLYKYMDKQDPLFKEVESAFDETISYFIKGDVVEMHELKCFNELFQEVCDQIDCSLFKQRLIQQNMKVIEQDTNKWFTEYSPKPTQVFVSMHSPGAKEHIQLLETELKLTFEHRNNQGVFDLPWEWNQYPKDSLLAKKEWMGIIALKILRAIKEYKLHLEEYN